MTLSELYELSTRESVEGEKARRLLLQTDWFARMAEFDPRSGEALTQSLTPFLRKVSADSRPAEGWGIHDRLSRIVDHCRFALEHIIKVLNENPRREHSEIPVRDVRELDAACFMKLSTRPGRTIREKLASKPYLLAVRRFQSIDLPENRLVKVFAQRLVELLRARAECLGAWLQETPDDLIDKLERWLRSDEAEAISRWDNPPPNNTLLSHRNYRRVYDAWRWMQSLEDDISLDLMHLEERQVCMDFWHYVADLRFRKKVIIAEVPVKFSYDSFAIESWLNGCVWLYDDRGHHELPVGSRLDYEPPDRIADNPLPVLELPVCIDFTTGITAFTAGEQVERLAVTLAYQQWVDREGREDISLFTAGAAYKGAGVTTVDSSDFFKSPKSIRGQAYEAAVSIVADLRRVFRHDSLTWLVPDIVKDFDLTPLRQAINAVYNDAEPVPRSIAAVFQLVRASDIRKDGFAVAVVDRMGCEVFVTKLMARYDEKLKKVLPETRGYAWERQPSVLLYSGDMESIRCNYDFVTEERQWRFAEGNVSKLNCSDKELIKHIGAFDVSIFIDAPPILGGYRLRSLEGRSQGVALWYDQLPELSVKAMVNGRYQRFYLVSRGTTVRPVRGEAVRIPIEKTFTLSAGRQHYLLPLFIGEKEDALGFSAKLESSVFPLKNDLECNLNMTFTYGAGQQYSLVFEPKDRSIPPIRIKWDETIERVVSDAPSPEYPSPMKWGGLRNWKDAQGKETDLLQWIVDSISKLDQIIPDKNCVTLVSPWRQKKSDKGESYWFAFAKTDRGMDCYCNTTNFINEVSVNPNDSLPIGSRLYCYVRKRKVGWAAFSISPSSENVILDQETKLRILRFRERSLQNRISFAFGDGRSLGDSDCPDDFKHDFLERFSRIVKKLPKELVESKMRFLQSCLHKDAPEECVNWIYRQIERRRITDKRAIGFALGDVSEYWQKNLMEVLLANINDDTLRVLAYAIWREQHLVERLSFSECKSILFHIIKMMKKISPCPPRKWEHDKNTSRDWVRATAEPLELLLGMLRTRASLNSEIRMLLQPHQQITKELAQQVEHVAEIVFNSHKGLYSRVRLGNLPAKLAGDQTPDLLYALRLYLTGDAGADAIRITGVSDNDDDE